MNSRAACPSYSATSHYSADLKLALSVGKERVRGRISCMKSSLLSILLLLFVSQCHASEVGITTKSVPNGTAKTYYSAVISASGGCTPYKWAVVSGNLPTGVKATASTQTTSLDLSGTPTVAASYSFTVSVTGCGGHVSEASYKTVINPQAVQITTKSVPNGTAKTYYSAVITASGGCTPYRWAVVSGNLPPGVKATASTQTTSLDLRGTPAVAASYSFTVSVIGCGGHVSEASYKSVINPPAVQITSKSVPNGTAKTYYSAVITASGGCTPYKWAVVSGNLPPGVKGTASTQTTSLDLRGTPTVAASYSFTVSVTGCGGHVSEASYKTVINPQAVQIT